jgi:hypothetical protein
MPISLLYAPKQGGPWTAIPGATKIDNTGRFVWRMESNVPYELFVRVEAVDEAGNVGTADCQTSVKVDLAIPKARVSFEGIKALPTAPPGGAPPGGAPMAPPGDMLPPR